MGKLSSADEGIIDEHLLLCEACRRALQETEAIIKAIRLAFAVRKASAGYGILLS